MSVSTGYPNTYLCLRPDQRVRRRAVFDPALKQFPRALRHGEPAFNDTKLAAEWSVARWTAMDHILRVVAGSEWRESLVLRGSVLLAGWLGDAARDPGDMDWVVIPEKVKLTDRAGQRLIDGVTDTIRCAPPPPGLEIEGHLIRTDDIWTYDRAPGRRVIVPWGSGHLPTGWVQMDFVFQEPLSGPPSKAVLDPADDQSGWLYAATPAQSLAWKLMWLDSDMYPQAKDLYDATLLAESTTLLPALPAEVTGGRYTPQNWSVNDWAEFVAKYPHIQGSAGDWQNRLAVALRRPSEETNDD